MKTCILFSVPLPSVIKKISPKLFPQELENKVFAYIPSDGADVVDKVKHAVFWKYLCTTQGAKFLNIDNSKVGSDAQKEIEKLQSANIVMLTGGNTFTLLRNLRRSGLDKALIDFAKRDNIVLAGFSAGAAVLTPTINIVNKEWSYGKDINSVNLDDISGLNIVNFEVLPHFKKADIPDLEYYRRESTNEVKTIADDEFICLDF